MIQSIEVGLNLSYDCTCHGLEYLLSSFKSSLNSRD